MLRKTLTLAAVAALFFAAPTAASADDTYAPDRPTAPTLAGSTATAVCDGDVPWIYVTASLTDPDTQTTSHTVHLVITNGSERADLVVGDLDASGKLSGRVLWPGASVGPDGEATGWPGWAFQNGQWVETSGNFAWTRGNISAEIEVNPEIPVPLSYPPATPDCATSPDTPATPAGTAGTGLAETGVSSAFLPIGIGAALLAVVGVGLIAVRRPAKR